LLNFKAKYLLSDEISKLILLSIWLVGTFVSLPFIWMVEYSSPNECRLNISKNYLIYVLSLNLVLIFIPAVGLSILYIIIIFKIRQIHKAAKNLKIVNQKNEVNDEPNTSRASRGKSVRSYKRKPKKSNKKCKITIIISIITILFYCCQLPVRIFLCWSYFRDYAYRTNINISQYGLFDLNTNSISRISKAVTLIYFLHCVSNPIIYNLLSSRFRKAVSYFGDYKKLSYRSTLRNIKN